MNSLTEIAVLEGIDNSYVSRVVNLTTMAPDIVEVVLEHVMPDHLTLLDIAVDPPALWEAQLERVFKPILWRQCVNASMRHSVFLELRHWLQAFNAVHILTFATKRAGRSSGKSKSELSIFLTAACRTVLRFG